MSYKINKYPDGTSYVSYVKEGPILFRINSYEDLWHLNQVVDAYISTHGEQPVVDIPNLIDAQADRRFNKNESAGLKLVCKFLNSLSVKEYQIFHPHNAEVVEALIDNVTIIDNSAFVKRALNCIDSDNLILMSSDAGGFKPLMKLCDNIEWKGGTFSASKSRKYEGGESKLIQTVGDVDFEGKDILIIDDLSVYGGTFKGLSKILKEKNCGDLYLAISHMTIQDLSKDPLTNYYDYVFTTNSKFEEYIGLDSNKFLVINMF